MCLSVQSSRLDDRRISLELIGGWLFALSGLRTTTGLSSWELSRCPGSDRGVRRRWRRLGAGFTGSPSEDGVSAGPLSVSVSSEGPLLFAAATMEPPLVSFTPFSTTETEKTLQVRNNEAKILVQKHFLTEFLSLVRSCL